MAGLPNPPFCVGFAAESRNLDEYAEGKRKAKKLPMVVGNLVQDGLGGDDNQVVLFDDAGRHPLPRAPKPEVARASWPIWPACCPGLSSRIFRLRSSRQVCGE